MVDMEARVKMAVAAVEQHDRQLSDELQRVRGDPKTDADARTLSPALESATPGLEAVRPALALETIVLRVGRPVLAVVRDEPRLEFRDAESEVWRQRLLNARPQLIRAIKAVGRIEVEYHPLGLEWIGTGWLVTEDLVVTNRHVAREFGRRNGQGFVFRQGLGGRRMTATIDFLEEFERAESLEFRLAGILHIEEEDGHDVAFLRVEPGNGASRGEPITLASTQPAQDQQVVVIGYPARDSRIPDQALMQEIFGDVFDKKRLAPGQITGSQAGAVLHDCSTLGGNSGSVVLDLRSGEALALHFAGRFLEANFAVPAAIIAESLDKVIRGEARSFTPRVAARSSLQRTVIATTSLRAVTCMIPIRVIVEVGSPLVDRAVGTTLTRALLAPASTDSDEDVVETEAVAADYVDRLGYDRHFLGSGIDIPLPAVTPPRANDILGFQVNGKTERELRYEHFSVVMSRRRRLCFLSAANVDGQRSKKVKRVGWRRDPRIPQEAQIIRECYGDSPRFSRGHMTRREDPVWGAKEQAALGNADSMHVTNVVPQMQPFNAGIWLGLEDYALEHTREDEMRIAVFTGPFLLDDDPARFGVKIPRSFWKVIAFIHDDTGELCATGYSMSQEDFLREEEFVFGQHETSQVSISMIEQQTGLSFDQLRSRDPFAHFEEALPRPLTDFREIRFLAR